MNCFQISIFAVANTTKSVKFASTAVLWIAFKLVSLQLQTQHRKDGKDWPIVVNCFQISIFAVANTTLNLRVLVENMLWIAFKLVSLQLQTQQSYRPASWRCVVNCFQISIFAVANTTGYHLSEVFRMLWIAFKLVSLQLQTQPIIYCIYYYTVVNCFQISIFAVANTTLQYRV